MSAVPGKPLQSQRGHDGELSALGETVGRGASDSRSVYTPGLRCRREADAYSGLRLNTVLLFLGAWLSPLNCPLSTE